MTIVGLELKSYIRKLVDESPIPIAPRGMGFLGGTMKEEQGYLTLEQASEYVQIPKETLKKKVYEGKLKAYKPGKRLLFSRLDLDNFVKKAQVA